ncbi:MAG: hypothetical protein ACFFBV_05270 [Promethearchaeota archaeon]
MKSKIYVIKRESREATQALVLRTLKLISLKDIINNLEEKILINPNWLALDHFSTGNITSKDTLEGIILYLIKEANVEPKKIIVADGGSFGVLDKIF